MLWLSSESWPPWSRVFNISQKISEKNIWLIPLNYGLDYRNKPQVPLVMACCGSCSCTYRIDSTPQKKVDRSNRVIPHPILPPFWSVNLQFTHAYIIIHVTEYVTYPRYIPVISSPLNTIESPHSETAWTELSVYLRSHPRSVPSIRHNACPNLVVSPGARVLLQ